MATSRKPAKKATRTSTAKKRTTRKKRTPSLYPRRRPSRPGLPTTIGTALGTLAVTTLLDASWPVRIGLLVLVLVLGSGYVLWKARHEIAAGADPTPAEPTSAEPNGAAPSPAANPTAYPADDPGSSEPVAD